MWSLDKGHRRNLEESQSWVREAQNAVSRAVQIALEGTQKSPGNRSDHEFLVGIGLSWRLD